MFVCILFYVSIRRITVVQCPPMYRIYVNNNYEYGMMTIKVKKCIILCKKNKKMNNHLF